MGDIVAALDRIQNMLFAISIEIALGSLSISVALAFASRSIVASLRGQ